MTDKQRFTMLTMHEFKAKMCEYMRRLHAGDAEYIVKRYNRPVAFVLSVPLMELNQEAEKSLAALNLYLKTLERHEEERRVLRARLLSWPGYTIRERCLKAEEAKSAKLYRDTFGKY